MLGLADLIDHEFVAELRKALRDVFHDAPHISGRKRLWDGEIDLFPTRSDPFATKAKFAAFFSINHFHALAEALFDPQGVGPVVNVWEDFNRLNMDMSAALLRTIVAKDGFNGYPDVAFRELPRVAVRFLAGVQRCCFRLT